MELKQIAENLDTLAQLVESNESRPSAEQIARLIRVQQARVQQIVDDLIAGAPVLLAPVAPDGSAMSSSVPDDDDHALVPDDDSVDAPVPA